MSKQINGGPAFPSFVPDGHYNGSVHEEGLSLRDYFIAHAPAEPQQWFEPAMPEKPLVPNYKDELPRVLWSQWENLEIGYVQPHEVMPEVAAFWEKARAAQTALDAWFKEKDKQRFLQWPAAWADEMLKARQQ